MDTSTDAKHQCFLCKQDTDEETHLLVKGASWHLVPGVDPPPDLYGHDSCAKRMLEETEQLQEVLRTLP